MPKAFHRMGSVSRAAIRKMDPAIPVRLVKQGYRAAAQIPAA
jgi:hypothetical protein